MMAHVSRHFRGEVALVIPGLAGFLTIKIKHLDHLA